MIYIESAYSGTRYLLGCDALNCCHEPQDSNQVEFQIPNIYYSDPRKEVTVNYARKNITNFNEIIEADEWSWALTLPDGTPVERFWAYTIDCEACVNKVQLLQWKVNAVGTQVKIQFKDYRGYDAASDEGKEFASSFKLPAVCSGNILTCPDNLHDKYFTIQGKGK